MRHLYYKISDYFRRHPFAGYLFIIFSGLAVFSFIQANKVFADPDSFYHAKIAVLMLKQGIVKSFPWLAFTALPEMYTDHHFLYHILLIPFVKFFHPLLGLKIATVIINTAFITLFYHFLKSNKTKWPVFFTLLLLGSAPFLFRISLAKANGLSLIFVMLILFFIFRTPSSPPPYKGGGGWGWLSILSSFYVWAYGGWPIGILITGVYLLSSILANFIIDSDKNEKLLNCYIVKLLKNAEWRPLVATVFGSVAGLVVNPYFPQNLKFYWMQTVEIAIVNYGAKIGVGAEWYGFSLPDLISYSWPMIFFIFLAMIFFVGRVMTKKYGGISREEIINSFFFIVVSGIFFVLTLKSCRNTEYSFPFMIITASFLLKYFYSEDVREYLEKNILKILKNENIYKGIVIYIVIMLIVSFVGGIWRVKSDLSSGFIFNEYKEAMAVAQKNSNFGDIIFHSDWDDWPMLFYQNDYNRYIVGLDATFMYKYNKDLYKKWRDITLGEYEGDPYVSIKNDFKSMIIFIADRDVEKMDKYFKNDGRYELLYNEGSKVYKIR